MNDADIEKILKKGDENEDGQEFVIKKHLNNIHFQDTQLLRVCQDDAGMKHYFPDFNLYLFTCNLTFCHVFFLK